MTYVRVPKCGSTPSRPPNQADGDDSDGDGDDDDGDGLDPSIVQCRVRTCHLA